MRSILGPLLSLLIVACPVLCGTWGEAIGLGHAASLGEDGGRGHSPLTPTNDGDDCICQCQGAASIESPPLPAPSAAEAPTPGPFAWPSMLDAPHGRPSTAAGSTLVEIGGPRPAPPADRARLRVFRC